MMTLWLCDRCAMPILSFFTCIIQRSSVLCGLPDKHIAWAAFRAVGADQQGSSYSREGMRNGSKLLVVCAQKRLKSMLIFM